MISGQADARPYFHREEICRSNRAPMALKKRRPRYSLSPFRRWNNAVLFENVANRLPRCGMPEVEQRASYCRISPTRVLLSHPYGQLWNLIGDAWSSRTPLGGAVVLLGDQLAMPSQNGVWRYDGRNLSKHPSPQRLALHRQTPTLIVRKPNSLAFQLRLENLVLFLDVRDHIELMPVDPAGQANEEQLPCLRCIHAPILQGKRYPISRWNPASYAHSYFWTLRGALLNHATPRTVLVDVSRCQRLPRPD